MLLTSTGRADLLEQHLHGCTVCKKACSSGDRRFRTAVHNALSLHQHVTALSLLRLCKDLRAGIDTPRLDGMTFLYRTVFFNHLIIVEYMLAHNAKPLVHCPDEGSEYAMHLAVDIAARNLVKMLLHHGR